MSVVRWMVAVMLLLFALGGGAMAAITGASASAERSANLAAQLRCLVCQNQSIADSSAPLAVDLRQQIDEQIAAGRGDSQIIDFMVERYGDFVLYRPPLKTSTVVLWFGPALLLLIGVVSLRRLVRRQSIEPLAAPLSASEHARARALLDGEEARTK